MDTLLELRQASKLNFTIEPNLVVRAADEIERLRAALEKYGRHTGVCHFLGGKDCNCGWENIQRTLTAAMGTTDG
jgi:hypothetical protein